MWVKRLCNQLQAWGASDRNNNGLLKSQDYKCSYKNKKTSTDRSPKAPSLRITVLKHFIDDEELLISESQQASLDELDSHY